MVMTPVKFLRHRFLATSLLIAITLFNLSSPVLPVQAAASISVSPITWNVVGLDSNNVNVGPNIFPVGARVCNTGDAVAYNIKSTFNWTSAATYIGLRSGSATSYTADGVNLTPGSCYDFYYEVEITRNSAAYDTTRHYNISATANTAADNSGTTLNGATPSNREIYVEHLISQNRNSTTDIKLDGVSVPVGSTMTLVVGNTYNLTLIGSTATQGYNQIEDYISIPNTIFRVNSVATYYSADNSAYVPNYNNKLYGDACYWDNDYTSTTYRSCIGSDGKAGGSVTTTYNVTIISGAGTQSMNSMIYDFSGSSYHYNSDYSTSARTISLVSPSDLQFAKSFNPSTTTAGGTSTLSFTITNPNAVSITDVNFSDTLPGTLVIASTPAVTTTNCGSPTVTAAAGTGTISASTITLAPSGTCVISVSISAPSNTGSPFTNTSGHLYVGTLDTTKTATANLTVNAYTAPSGVCSTFQAAKWSFATGISATAPPADATPAVTAAAKNGPGLTPVLIDTSSSVTDGTGSWNTTAPIATASTLSPSLDQYYQFAINTAGMTSLQMSFSYIKSNTGPGALALYYGSTEKPATAAETGTLKSYSFTAPSTSWTGSGNITFSSSEIVNGTTYFRIYPYDSQVTSSSVFNIDTVVFTGTGCFPPLPAKLSKSFGTDPIAVSGTSLLSFTLNNPNSTVALTNLSFTDTLPTGLSFVDFSPSSQCNGGTLTRSSASTISFAGGSLAAGASCSVTATVTGGTAGAYNNTSSFITATYETGSGPANITNNSTEGYGTDTLTVLQAPSITKLFGTNPILEGGISTLSFIISNPNQNNSLPNITFSDTLPTSPAQMLVATTPNISYSGCGSGVLTPAGDRRSFTFSNGTIAAGGTCTVQVDITAPTAGTYANSTSNVKATIASVDATGNSDSDSLLVNTAHPGISIIKQISSTASGPWSNNLVTALPSTIYYRIVIENTGDVPLSPVSVSDPDFPTELAGCSWPATLPVASATQDPTASCIFSISAGVSPSTLTNTATASGTYSSTPYTATDSATYANADLALTKSVTETSYAAAGTVLNYTYTVTNNGASILAGPVTITDSNTTVTCPPGDLTAYPGPGNSITCTSTYTVTSADVSLGSITNLATATADGVTSNRAIETITMSRADLAVTKANDTGGAKILGTPFNWIITVTNIGDSSATFTSGQNILRDPLPSGPTYGTPTISGITNITNSGNIACSVDVSNVLTCRANGGSVTLGNGTGSFAVTIGVSPSATGTLTNTATADPDIHLVETTKSNNSATDSVVVSNYTQPTIAKAFSPTSIGTGGTSTITFTLTNTNPANLTSATFTDTLSNMSISGNQSAGGTCTGASGNNFTNGATNLSFSGLTIPSSGSCTVTVVVTSSAVGTHPNAASGVTTDQTTIGTGSASVDLTVLAKPTIAKAFSPATITLGGTSTITFTLSNSNSVNLTAATFTDTLTNMAISGAQNAAGTCTGASGNSFTDAATNLTFSGLTIPSSGSCTVTVLVTSSTAGVNPNQTSGVTTADTTVGSASPSVNLTVLAPPTIVKAFSPSTISSGGTSTITFTLTNSNASALTGASFSDTLTNMAISTTQNAAGTCVGASMNSFTAGATNLNFSGITIPLSSSCTVTVVVTSSTAGVNPNSTTGVTTSQTTIGTGSGVANLSVLEKATISKAFSPSTISSGDDSTITFTLANLNSIDLTGAGFTDTLSNMSISGAQNASGTCTGASGNSFTDGATSLTFSGITIPAGSNCTVTIVVTSTSTGVHPNATSGVTTNETTIGAPSGSVNLTVLAKPTIAKAFSPATISSTGTSTITFTLTNSIATTLTSATFTDTLVNMSISGAQNAGGTCTGASGNAFSNGETDLTFNGITIPASGSCTVTVLVTSSTPGVNPNTTSGLTTDQTTTGSPSSTANLTVLAPPTIAKAFSPATITSGGTSTITFTLSNSNATALTNAEFTDTLANMAISSTQNAGGTCTGASSNSFTIGDTDLNFSGITIPSLSTCTVTVTVTSTTVGVNPNVTSGVDTTQTLPGPVSSSVDLTVLASPTIAKAFSPTSIPSGDTSTITFTLSNTNATNLTGASFTDTLVDMSISGAQTAGGTCTGAGSNTFVNGETALAFSGITIPSSGSCTVTIVVTSSTVGVHPNTTSGVTTDQTTIGSPAPSVDLTVTSLAAPAIAVVKTSTTTAISAANQVIPYRFSITNPGNTDLHTVTVVDAMCDSAPVYSSGDTNSDTILQQTETWIYACSHTVTQTEFDAGGSLTNTVQVDSAETLLETATHVIDILGTISGTVWNDLNGDGTMDSGELPISGVTVRLYDNSNNLVGTAVTGANGTYLFSGLTDGNYTVVETDISGYSSTTPNSVATTILAGNHRILDFGDLRIAASTGLGRITGTVINDIDGNGTRNGAEGPISGVNLSLLDQNGNVVHTTTTAADGTYSFNSLPPGQYSVVETDPLGYISTTLNSISVFLAGSQVADVDYFDQVSGGANIIDPAVTKQGSPERAVVGDEVIYTITVGNIGNQTASNVVLVDTKPAFLDILTVTINPDPGVTPSISGNTITINFGTMLPGASYTVTVITRVNATGTPPGGTNNVVVTNDPLNLTDRPSNNASAATLAITVPPTGGGGSPDDDADNTLPATIPQTGFAPGVDSLVLPNAESVPYARTNFQLIIPSIDLNSPLVGVPKVNSDWDITWLGNDVGYLQGTAFPTLAGNSVVSGHVFDRNGKPGPFSKLGNLKWGDTVKLHGFGYTYTYEVHAVSEVSPENIRYVFHHEDYSWLTLFTCKNYDAETGTYKSRIVVKAVLIQIEEDQ